MRTCVIEAMTEAFERFGDPSRLHTEAIEVRYRLEEARAQVAHFFGAKGREVVFTSSATEALTTAIWGATRKTRGTIIATSVEHSAVLLAAAAQTDLITLPVDSSGRVDPASVKAEIEAVRASGGEISLVCCQLANHEIGTIQPVKEIVDICKTAGVLSLVDAAQAAGRIEVNFAKLGADMLAVSGHKLGGPPGTGALLIRRGLRIAPLLLGGEQERSRRAGLENIPAALGLGAACNELSISLPAERTAALAQMSQMRSVAAEIAGVICIGPEAAAERLPHLLCLTVADIEPQAILLALDQAGISAHSGSACSSESLRASPVLEAIGVTANHSLRFATTWATSEGDIEAACRRLPEIISNFRLLHEA